MKRSLWLRTISQWTMILAFPTQIFGAKIQTIKAPCVRYFAQMANETNRDLLSDRDAEKIASALRDPTITQKAALEEAFQIYAQARLERVPDEARGPLIKILKTKTKTVINPPQISVHGEYDGEKIELGAPTDRYLESVILLGARAHEFEHAIVDHIHRAAHATIGLPGSDLGFRNSLKRYYAELGAMRAEWTLLRAIPKDLREEASRTINNDSSLTPLAKEFYTRTLKNADLDRESFVEAEHQAGRYNPREVLENGFQSHKDKIKAMTQIVSAVGGMRALQMYCEKKSGDNSVERTTEWYEKICLPLIGAPPSNH